MCSILEALLSFKRNKHSWGWKAESEASENRTVVGRNNGCGNRVKDEEEEEGKGFADRVSRASIFLQGDSRYCRDGCFKWEAKSQTRRGEK